MENRQFPDFTNTQEWNLVGRGNYEVQRLSEKSYVPIPSQNWYIANSSVIIVGISTTNSSTRWKTGGWAQQILPFLPSSNSNFVAATQTERRWIRLGTLTLCVFPKIVSSWILELSFPFWLEQVTVEIWRYDGADVDVFTRLNQLDASIQALQTH